MKRFKLCAQQYKEQKQKLHNLQCAFTFGKKVKLTELKSSEFGEPFKAYQKSHTFKKSQRTVNSHENSKEQKVCLQREKQNLSTTELITDKIRKDLGRRV